MGKKSQMLPPQSALACDAVEREPRVVHRSKSSIESKGLLPCMVRVRFLVQSGITVAPFNVDFAILKPFSHDMLLKIPESVVDIL